MLLRHLWMQQGCEYPGLIPAREPVAVEELWQSSIRQEFEQRLSKCRHRHWVTLWRSAGCLQEGERTSFWSSQVQRGVINSRRQPLSTIFTGAPRPRRSAALILQTHQWRAWVCDLAHKPLQTNTCAKKGQYISLALKLADVSNSAVK